MFLLFFKNDAQNSLELSLYVGNIQEKHEKAATAFF